MQDRAIRLLLLLALTAAAGPAQAQEAPSHIWSGTLTVAVPKAVQEDLYEKVVDFALKVYPEVNPDEFRSKCKEQILRDQYVIRGAGTAGGPRVLFAGPPGVDISYPSGGSISTGTGSIDVPKEMEAATLRLEDARPIAESVLARLFPDPKDRALFELGKSYEVDTDDFCSFEWRDKPANLQRLGRAVSIDVRQKDAYVMGCSVRSPVEPPAISYEEMCRIAKDKFEYFYPQHLWLQQHFYGGRRVLQWTYAVPKYGYADDFTKWNASTGELIYSEALNGGEVNAAYLNPAYYRPYSQSEILANVQAAVEERVKHLATR